MAYVRFGSTCGVECNNCPGSDVYLFFNSDDYYECCGCQLPVNLFRSSAAVYLHLRHHVRIGDHVDKLLIQQFLEHADYNGAK